MPSGFASSLTEAGPVAEADDDRPPAAIRKRVERMVEQERGVDGHFGTLANT